MRRINAPDRWRSVDAPTWDGLWSTFLGTDQPSPADVARILVSDSYQPGSFTIAERFTGPRWLDPGERDGDAWLRGLVTRRLPPQARVPGRLPDAVGHV